MVSALWNACATEVQDLQNVQQQLKEPGVDLEIKGELGNPAAISTSSTLHCGRRPIWQARSRVAVVQLYILMVLTRYSFRLPRFRPEWHNAAHPGSEERS
jgi:hypothetical protein